ncbi:MAG: PLP-dependent aminotransferase family protein, partial [Oscillospiraceae bacterium]|nr:PLP-dependent aminotransferase family protein [Oscillospiraceae bacterium]
MLTYDINNRGESTIYEYLYGCIKADIMEGRLAANEKLPSKRTLAKNLGVSVTSIENAYDQLGLEGFIRAEAGKGFFVNEIGKTEAPEEPEPLHDKSLAEIEDRHKEFIIDFKANRTSIENFPFTVWAKLVRNLLSDRNEEILGTIPYNGLKALRVALAKHLYMYRGMEVDPRQIIIGAGTEYLYSRLLQMFGQNTVIAIEDPGYKKFSEISSSQGILWDYIPIDREGMRLDMLQDSLANVIHVSPANHFPTGTVMPINRRLDLLNWAYQKPDRYIIEDDYDSELRYAGSLIPPMFAMDSRNKVIYINTFSKSIVPSLRISYMVLPPYLMELYRDTLSFYSCTVSSFEQMTLAHFISEGYFDRHINRMKRISKAKRDEVLNALMASPLSNISEIMEANAGTHFLLHVDTRLSDRSIKKRASEHHIELAMLSDYMSRPSLKS